MDRAHSPSQVHRLLDAIEMVEDNQRAEAREILRGLIQEDNDWEEAWLWMSVAVDSIDQSSVCLDNVLRINPENTLAASALYRLRLPEIVSEKRRAHLRFWRDTCLSIFWLLVVALLFGMLCAGPMNWGAVAELGTLPG